MGWVFIRIYANLYVVCFTHCWAWIVKRYRRFSCFENVVNSCSTSHHITKNNRSTFTISLLRLYLPYCIKVQSYRKLKQTYYYGKTPLHIVLVPGCESKILLRLITHELLGYKNPLEKEIIVIWMKFPSKMDFQ